MEVANSIYPWLQFTGVTVGPEPDSMVPMLDSQGRIDHNSGGGEQIRFKYYEKSCSSPLVLMNQSAMGTRQKFQTLSN